MSWPPLEQGSIFAHNKSLHPMRAYFKGYLAEPQSADEQAKIEEYIQVLRQKSIRKLHYLEEESLPKLHDLEQKSTTNLHYLPTQTSPS